MSAPDAPAAGLPERTRLARRVRLKDKHVITTMMDIASGLPDVIKLGRGDPDLDTPEHIVKAGQEALGSGATHYTHPMGMPELRQAIADNIAAYGGARYAPEEIVVTPGGQQAMFIIALGLLDPGDELLIPCPGYNPYLQAAELTEARLVEIRTSIETNFTLTAEMVRRHITPRSKVLVLINPGNPTGTVIPPDEVRKICRLAIEHDLIVVSDEIYARIVYDDCEAIPVAAEPGMKERTITLSGVSKAYAMTGWRVGYFAGPRRPHARPRRDPSRLRDLDVRGRTARGARGADRAPGLRRDDPSDVRRAEGRAVRRPRRARHPVRDSPGGLLRLCERRRHGRAGHRVL